MTFAPFAALVASRRALPDDADDLDIFVPCAAGGVDGVGRREGRRAAGMARGRCNADDSGRPRAVTAARRFE